MGIFQYIFSLTPSGKIAKSTCGIFNTIRRRNVDKSELEIYFLMLENRFGENSDVVARIVGNIYYQKFFPSDSPGADGLKLGFMDFLVYILYFELGARVFDDINLIGKAGQILREEGFSTKEINGRIYDSGEFPKVYFDKYVKSRECKMLDLEWRDWM